jgi:hypothetical protein
LIFPENARKSLGESAPVMLEEARLIPRILLPKVRPFAGEAREIADCFVLNIFQSVDERAPVTEVDERARERT